MKLISTLCISSLVICASAQMTKNTVTKNNTTTLASASKSKNEISAWFKSVLKDQVREQEIARIANSTNIPQNLEKVKLNNKKDVERFTTIAWNAYKATQIELGNKALIKPSINNPGPQVSQNRGGNIEMSGESMPYILLSKGTKPKKGWPLFIATHGGGMDSRAKGKHSSIFNNREWQAQTSLATRVYPDNAMYFVPRMPNDAHGRWWYDYGQDMYLSLLRNVILFQDVDPNRIYFIGISEGGYATYRLAPFMADKFAACGAMAAGDYPSVCPAENLMATPFFTSIGELDTGYGRIKMARTFHEYLDKLAKDNKNLYKNGINVQKGRGHGIEYSIAPKWVYNHVRNPYPAKIHWINHKLHNTYRTNLFWLEADEHVDDGNISYEASYNNKKNEINVKTTIVKRENNDAVYTPYDDAKFNILVNDTMLNLNKPVKVIVNGKEVFNKKVERDAKVILESVAKFGDYSQIYCGKIEIK